MTKEKQDPELIDDPQEGIGDESAYFTASIEYDPEQFELPDDYEYEEEGEEE